MKHSEVASLDNRSLVVREYETGRDLASAKFRHALGQLENNNEIRSLRRSRAQLKTEIRRREIEAGLSKDDLYRQNAAAIRTIDSGADAVEGEGANSGGLLANLRRRLSGGASDS